MRATKTLTGLSLLMIAVVDDLVEGLQFAEICASVSSARARRRALYGFAAAASHACRLSQWATLTTWKRVREERAR